MAPGAASAIFPEEYHLISKLRGQLMEAMPEGIPNDLDTDLNLVRWIRGYKKNLEKIVEVFPVYVASRKAAKLDLPDLPEQFFDLPHIKPFLQYIASSRLSDRVWSEENNAFLFVERGWSQPKEFVKAMHCSDYLVHCLGYSEMLLQLILRREKHQDPRKGPVQFIVLFDLAEVNIRDHLNPLNAHMKLWILRSKMWEEWYPEVVQHICIVNPPKVVSILWKIARLFMSEKSLKLMEIIANEKDILDHYPAFFIPKEFGGKFINTMPPGDESGASRRRKITSSDHLQLHEIYRVKGLIRPEQQHQEISCGDTFTYRVDVPRGHSMIIWDFVVSCEVTFTIYGGKERSEMVYPKFRLGARELPEEGILEDLKFSSYIFEFQNNNSFFSLKLDYCVMTA